MPGEPLAARMRPRNVDEVVGQRHLLAPGRLLRRAIEADQLSSLILHGPPGTGKTTLARVIASHTQARFVGINAVLAGVADIRAAVDEARKQRDGLFKKRTILFVDEVHRFNKAQQDALLPWVEDGTFVLVGATTENPTFEVNKALVSRSRLFRLEPLTDEDLGVLLDRAVTDPERGLGALAITVTSEARAHLVDVANGDARVLLNALELAATTTPTSGGAILVDLAVAEDSIQRRAVLYDREGDAHFDTISAFIKAIRGSDPDAALYWLARMLYAGEDPRFVLRRLLISASEDVGLANPAALGHVIACATAFDRVGLPEGRFHLAQATLLLAASPKSNSTMGLFDALKAVENERTTDVPVHLKDASRDAELGHGKGYLYPHAYQDHWVAQQYLPTSLKERVFWQPSDQGDERALRDGVARRREAQLAGMVAPLFESVSWAPTEATTDAWLARSAGRPGAVLEALRDAVFAAASIERHHLVADLAAGTGLLCWEAVRRAPEGWVWAVAPGEAATALAATAERLGALRRPRIVAGDRQSLCAEALKAGVRFDRLIGRDVLGAHEDAMALATDVARLLLPGGRAVFAQRAPGAAQRLTALLESADPAWIAAEEAAYAELPEMTTRSPAALTISLTTPLTQASVSLVAIPGTLTLTRAHLDRWLAPKSSPSDAGSWADRVGGRCPDGGAALFNALRHLVGQTLPWTTTLVAMTIDPVEGRV